MAALNSETESEQAKEDKGLHFDPACQHRDCTRPWEARERSVVSRHLVCGHLLLQP